MALSGFGMAHSYRTLNHWVLVTAEIVLFVFTTVALAYLSAVQEWAWFLVVSIIATVIFIVTKVFEAWPGAKTSLHSTTWPRRSPPPPCNTV